LLAIALLMSVAWLQASESAFGCSGRCGGCSCSGFVTEPIDECYGTCYHEAWFGIYSTSCCVGGMGCHFIDP